MHHRSLAVALVAASVVASAALFGTAKSARALQQDAAPATRPAAAKPTPFRTLIISVDGGRPDLLLRLDLPHFRRLLKDSSYSFWARTTAVSITLPSHVSMLTGVQPNAHGITWNDDLPFERIVYPKVPTLFELAKKAGYSTALVAGKSKFVHLDKPGTVDFEWIAPTHTTTDGDVAKAALDILRSKGPDVLFVHFPGADNAGHAKGWGSPEQVEAFRQIDGHLGALLDALDELKLADSTYVIVSADHGGAGKNHGPDDVRSRTIPWVLRGPNVRKDHDLNLARGVEVKTEDTFATACYLLKIPTPTVEGTPVLSALKDVDLMKPDSAKR